MTECNQVDPCSPNDAADLPTNIDAPCACLGESCTNPIFTRSCEPYDFETGCSSVDGRLLVARFNKETGVVVLFETDGSAVTDGSTLVKCPDIEETQSCRTAVGDPSITYLRIDFWDTSSAPPTLYTTIWLDVTGAIIADPSPTDPCFSPDDTEWIKLCDDTTGDGTATVAFLRRLTVDSAGAVTFADFDLDGNAYTIIGTVGSCDDDTTPVTLTAAVSAQVAPYTIAQPFKSASVTFIAAGTINGAAVPAGFIWSIAGAVKEIFTADVLLGGTNYIVTEVH